MALKIGDVIGKADLVIDRVDCGTEPLQVAEPAFVLAVYRYGSRQDSTRAGIAAAKSHGYIRPIMVDMKGI